MKSRLATICNYVEEKISVAELDENTYISTENMITNRQGICKASSLPKTLTTRIFKKGDVLVSNIRPYFKKIWHATCDGGCSNDVLVFRNKENIDSTFLYYVLSNDSFFEYSMATAKGTKMPRGDKKSIMEYKVEYFTYEIQKKIANFLRKLDLKIKINMKINRNLEEYAA